MTNTPTPPANASQYLELLWKQGQRLMAQNMESAARKGTPNVKLFSCNTELELEKFVTVNPGMLKLKATVQKLQAEEDPVLIVGPTGTGKEIIARALHGGRWGKFVPVNCTALPSELLESELFGHKKGSFTGALEDRVGKFRAAHAGTLFLDEIGDMPIDMQAKLLRVLQEKVVVPLGTDKEEPVNCRVVAATNKSIEELLNRLHFREDLYHRLAVFTLQTTALLDRQEDVRHIVDALGGEKIEDTKILITNGNVRSLQAQVRRFQVLGE